MTQLGNANTKRMLSVAVDTPSSDFNQENFDKFSCCMADLECNSSPLTQSKDDDLLLNSGSTLRNTTGNERIFIDGKIIIETKYEKLTTSEEYAKDIRIMDMCYHH